MIKQKTFKRKLLAANLSFVGVRGIVNVYQVGFVEFVAQIDELVLQDRDIKDLTYFSKREK